MSEDTKTPGSQGFLGASRWLVALAATAGLGAGAGAAAGKSSAAPREPAATTGAVASGPSLARVARPVEPAPTVSKDQASSGSRLAAGGTAPAAEVVAPDVPVAADAADTAGGAGAVTGDAATVAPIGSVGSVTPLGPVDPAALEASLDEVFKKQKLNRAFAKDFYATHGAGRFSGANGPTALGQAVLARIAALPEHGIDPAPYELDALQAAVKGDAPLLADVRLFQRFLDLVMDSRFLHKAGPFKLLDRTAVYDREKKELKDFVAQVMAAPDASAAMALFDPPHPQYTAMRGALATYRAIADAGGCPKLSPGWRFRKGSHGEEVKKLQQRLACEGYYQGEIDGKFEGATVEAVKDYQAHHDLPNEEGTALEDTVKSLNVPIEFRVKEIKLALQRMRESRFDRMGDYFIRVNIPSFMLRVWENGEVIREQKVIVGTNKLDDDKVQLVQGHINRTKIFGTRLYQVIVNPTWILPKRVEEGELATNVEKDGDYLAKSNIKKVKLGSGDEVFVQGAGKGNVLGKVKFLLEESNAIYLHDTDKRHLFKKQRRDFSHGCMRVHEAIEFGKWLLAKDGWSQDEVDKAFSMASLQRGFDMRKPVNLVTEYITVDLAADGKPVFYDDIYGYDEAYWNDKLPPGEKTRWGSEILRPRWVPKMDGETVDGWRKAGKAAPRNLGPDGKPKPVAKDPEVDDGP